MNKVKLLIGLGNPDAKYENTYHNIGHLFIGYLQQVNAFVRRLILLKTVGVFMNKSGEFVKETIKKYKVKPEYLLVVHDDADIELGNYKLSFGRGSAGHKGVQNIINHLKTQNFWRLRIGIRPSREKARAGADELVLKSISPVNKKKLEKVFKEMGKFLVTFLS